MIPLGALCPTKTSGLLYDMSKRPALLGRWMSTSLVVGNMIGSGIFLLPAALGAYGGISLLGWLVSSFGALVLALLFAQLSTVIKSSGGPYAYSKAAFGDFVGFLVTWGYWISICCTNAAIAVALVGYLQVLIGAEALQPFAQIAIGLFVVWFLTWLNSRGIREAGWMQLITTILKVVPLLVVSLVGLFWIDFSNFEPFNVSEVSNGRALINTATLTLFAFLGIECATIPSSSTEESQSTIPKSTIQGTLIAMVIYVLSSFVILGVIPSATLAESSAPFAEAGQRIGGNPMMYLVSIGAVISTFGALNGWILMQGQVPLAAAKDKLFPAIFSKRDKNDTPIAGLVISSIIVSVLLVSNYSKNLTKIFEFMILLATLTVLVPYLFSAAAHGYLTLQKKISKKMAKAVGPMAFLFSMLAVIGSGQEVVYWGFVLMMSGLPVYIWIKHKS